MAERAQFAASGSPALPTASPAPHQRCGRYDAMTVTVVSRGTSTISIQENSS
jgi:hypothetical protein